MHARGSLGKLSWVEVESGEGRGSEKVRDIEYVREWEWPSSGREWGLG